MELWEKPQNLWVYLAYVSRFYSDSRFKIKVHIAPLLMLFVVVPGIHHPKRFNDYLHKVLAVGFNWRIHHCAPEPGQSVFDHRFPGGNGTVHLVQVGTPPL